MPGSNANLGILITCLLHLATIPAAIAGLVINLGNISIPSGTGTYNVDVMVTGGDAVTDMVAYFQIGDGGPLFGGTSGPKITSIDLTGTIWSSAAGGFSRTDNITYPTQFQEMNVSLKTSGQTVAGNGKLCRLVLDTAGFSGTYALKMTTTLGGNTEFRSGAAVVVSSISNGSLLIGTSQPAPVAPPVSIGRLPAGAMRLSFPSLTGFAYTIQWDNDLTPPWTSINPALTGSNGTTLLWTDDGSQTGTSPAAASKRFYRVLVTTTVILSAPVAPSVTIQKLSAGAVGLSFPSETGRSYTIQWDNDLTQPWTTINPPLTGSTGTTLIWTDDGSQTGTSPVSVSKRFYRVLVN